MINLEVCANSFVSAVAAEQGGAIRVELCENMAEGGTTPSYATIKMAKSKLNIAVWPIIRPRGGDFLYTDEEFELMKIDIQMCKELGCDGVVFGILLANGEIDSKRCKQLLAYASPMPVAFHRAFDMCNDLDKGLEDLIHLGFVRVLTSGGAVNAYQGIEKITELVQLAKGRIEIMPGAGISPQNIDYIKKKTGATVFHSSARTRIKSKMDYRNKHTKMGSIEDEYGIEQTSAKLVKEMVLALLLLLILPIFAFSQSGKSNAPEFTVGSFADDYGITYTINDSLWIQNKTMKFHILKWNPEKQYLVAKNDANNKTDANKYTRIDYMTFTGMEPYKWGFCLTAYDAETDEIAEKTAYADRQNPKKGCNGYPFSRMKKIDQSKLN